MEDTQLNMEDWRCEGVVCDVDGTLLDSEPVYYECYAETVRFFGSEHSFDVHRHIMGTPAIPGAQYVIDALELECNAEEFVSKRNEFLHDAFSRVEAMPGARELLRHIKETLKLPLALATSASRESLELKSAKNADLFALADVVICGDDEAVRDKGKPRPDIFLHAAERLGVDPKKCLAFEDSRAGVEAAHAAGMRVIGIPDVRLPKEWFTKAEYLIEKLSDTPFSRFNLTEM